MKTKESEDQVAFIAQAIGLAKERLDLVIDAPHPPVSMLSLFVELRFGLLPDRPTAQKPPPASIRSPRHSPILPVRSLATSPKVSHSAPTPQKQKTRRVRRARSTPDSIDAPRARLRLPSIPDRKSV